MKTVLWGAYCATSWSWCIGMFLPKILIERFGWPGFLAFAIPNVGGCIAFGYVLKSRLRSDELVARHRSPMRWFSVVTVSYHMFFLVALTSWAADAFSGRVLIDVCIVSACFVLAVVLSGLSPRTQLPLAAIAYVGSLLVFFETGVEPLAAISWQGTLPERDLLWLAPVMLIGFSLCPFLDLTFHRALHESGNRKTFLIFGGLFALILVLTCAIWFGGAIGRSFAFAHILWQSVITMALHIREWRVHSSDAKPVECMIAKFAPLLGLGIGVAAVHWSFEEDAYVRMLVFYGLIFPAYAVFFMWRDPARGRSARQIAAWAVVIIALTPFFELAFVQSQMFMLVIPIAAFLSAIVIRLANISKKAPANQIAGVE